MSIMKREIRMIKEELQSHDDATLPKYVSNGRRSIEKAFDELTLGLRFLKALSA